MNQPSPRQDMRMVLYPISACLAPCTSQRLCQGRTWSWFKVSDRSNMWSTSRTSTLRILVDGVGTVALFYESCQRDQVESNCMNSLDDLFMREMRLYYPFLWLGGWKT